VGLPVGYADEMELLPSVALLREQATSLASFTVGFPRHERHGEREEARRCTSLWSASPSRAASGDGMMQPYERNVPMSREISDAWVRSK
jgi:hypothetical protein